MIFAAVQRGGDHYDTHFVHMCVVVTKSVVVICHVSHTLVGYRTGSCHPGPGPLSVAGLHQREARTTTIRTLPRGSSCLSWQRVCFRQNCVPEFLLALSIPRQSSRVGWQFERFFGRAENIRHSVQVGLNVVELVLLTYLPCLAGGFFFATLNLLCWRKNSSFEPAAVVGLSGTGRFLRWCEREAALFYRCRDCWLCEI